MILELLGWLFGPVLLVLAPANDDPAICAGAEQRWAEERARLGRGEMAQMEASLRGRCPQLAARIRQAIAALPKRTEPPPPVVHPPVVRPPVIQPPRIEPVPQPPPPLSCRPRVVGHPEFALTAMASGGFQLTAPAQQCPGAGLGDSLVVEIELCGGGPSPFSTLRPGFQGYDRNGSRIRSQIDLGVATAGPDRAYGLETRSGRSDPRFATGAAYAKLSLHGQGTLRQVAPQLCAVQIR